MEAVEERLDRALTTSTWLELFPESKLVNLIASHSGHSPIILYCDPVQRNSKKHTFRFENYWLNEEGITEVVKNGWRRGENHEVQQRLSFCAEDLGRWNLNRNRENKDELQRYKNVMEQYRGDQDPASTSRFFEAQTGYNKALIHEDTYWKQRAKMHWLRDGDRNTKFFHLSATVRKNKQKIDMLVNVNGDETRDQAGICDIARSYFENIYVTKDGLYDPLLNIIQPQITAEENCRLLLPISKAELQATALEMHPDKSSGPDGFNPAFFHKFWDLCGEDIWSAASHWLERGFFPQSLDETNICLIPKCIHPHHMKDYRPISLCNVIYKIVSKALANRLKVLLEKCISEEQSAFVEGRSILDNAMIAMEIIHALKRRTKGNKAHLAFEIDIIKAYDRVNWGFLRDRVGPIELGRGLRANVAEVAHLMSFLSIYADASEQEINLNKSEVFFSRNLNKPAQEDIAKIMGVHHVMGTGNYLGLPSMIGRSKKATFSFIKDRMWKRINSWRGGSLSKAGKVIMIKSVLQSIPAYIMSIFILPDATINDIEKMMNSFWWGGGNNHTSGIRWMSWDKLTGTKKEGGLGFRDLKAFNMAMVAKQGWNLISKPQTLVSRIYKAMYYPRTSFLDANIGYNPSFVWRSLWKARDVLMLGCRWSIGDGSQIMVMSDPWIRGRREGCIIGPQKQACEDILRVPLLKEVVRDRLIWKEEQNGLSDLLDPRLRSFTDAKSLILDFCSSEDRKVAGRFAVVLDVIWKNRNDLIWHNEKEEATKLGVAWDIGTLSILEAEASAIKEAIEGAIAMHLEKVIFESDAQQVKFIKRQANLVAHSLAKAANSWTRRSVINSIPPCIQPIILNEMH
ncbi:uncharacterized protein LOC131635640 [Vicia villosa]|uniref:uncharacterized protein LOC131635640 n=1 Tax=Vicia villosa TaxID=3911 RepID=UPI00273B5470|nr:uncharacterized protein LOC131635640 [Vicia villosa]